MLSGLRKFIRDLETDAIIVGIVGLIAGAIIILAIRYFTYHTNSVHYHANFKVYINGQAEPFKQDFYYEEESAANSCTTSENVTPEERAHMHDGVGDVAHVEDHAVTWGQFFQNLGWTVNSKLIQTPFSLYTVSKQSPVTFVLNGKSVRDITDKVIGDRDRLLINYGATSKKTLAKEFSSVPSTAAKYDTEKDPASCSGSKATTSSDRWHHLF